MKEPEDPTERLSERINNLSGDIISFKEVNKGLTVQTVMLMNKIDELIREMKELKDKMGGIF